MRFYSLNLEHRTENWTEIITPKKGLFELNLRELIRYKDLILLFVRRDFVSAYKQTVLGPIWFFIQPLFTTAIYIVIFTKIAKLSTDGIQPTLFYLSGVTIWTYFSDCLLKTSNTFVSNAGIFGKVYFPRLATPISIIISNFVKLAIQFLLLIIVYVYYIANGEVTFELSWTLLLIPYILLIVALLGLGLGIIFSSLTTKYRDLSFLIQFGIQLAMYATPVIYPYSSAGGKMKELLALNPLTSLLETFRFSLFNKGDFNLSMLAYSSIATIVILCIGIITFNKVEKSFMDTV